MLFGQIGWGSSAPSCSRPRKPVSKVALQRGDTCVLASFMHCEHSLQVVSEGMHGAHDHSTFLPAHVCPQACLCGLTRWLTSRHECNHAFKRSSTSCSPTCCGTLRMTVTTFKEHRPFSPTFCMPASWDAGGGLDGRPKLSVPLLSVFLLVCGCHIPIIIAARVGQVQQFHVFPQPAAGHSRQRQPVPQRNRKE